MIYVHSLGPAVNLWWIKITGGPHFRTAPIIHYQIIYASERPPTLTYMVIQRFPNFKGADWMGTTLLYLNGNRSPPPLDLNYFLNIICTCVLHEINISSTYLNLYDIWSICREQKLRINKQHALRLSACGQNESLSTIIRVRLSSPFVDNYFELVINL